MSSSVVKQHSIGSIVSNMNDSSPEASESAESDIDFRQYGHLFKNTSYEELEQACRSYHAEWTEADEHEHGALEYFIAGIKGVEQGMRSAYIFPDIHIRNDMEIALDGGDSLDNFRETVSVMSYAAMTATNAALLKTDFAFVAMPWAFSNLATATYAIVKDRNNR